MCVCVCLFVCVWGGGVCVGLHAEQSVIVTLAGRAHFILMSMGIGNQQAGPRGSLQSCHQAPIDLPLQVTITPDLYGLPQSVCECVCVCVCTFVSSPMPPWLCAFACGLSQTAGGREGESQGDETLG